MEKNMNVSKPNLGVRSLVLVGADEGRGERVDQLVMLLLRELFLVRIGLDGGESSVWAAVAAAPEDLVVVQVYK